MANPRLGEVKSSANITRVLSVAFSPAASRLASGGADQTIRLWDTQSGQTVCVLQGYGNWVISVALAPDGE